MRNQKPKLFVSEDDYTQYGYTTTRMVLRTGHETPICDLIEACIDNKAGYGSVEAAERVSKRYTWLRDAGYIGAYTSCYSGEGITLEWQHSKVESGDFCEMAITDLPRRLSEIRASLKLLERLFKAGERFGHRNYAIANDPKYMRDILARLRATPLISVTVPASVDGTEWFEWCTGRTLASVTAHKVA